ncbi:MAG: hypothetical protein KGO05_00375, partial [Chloroflexota bacterium]|nr:hypothetical protein [Chloroflexota bacterium]
MRETGVALINSIRVATRGAAEGAVNWLRSLANATEQSAAPTRQPLPVKRVAAQATGMWLATRIAFVLITVLAPTFGFAPLGPTPQGVFSANPQYAPVVLPFLINHPMLANWVHWDASWYLLISMRGYDIFTASTTTWFPMYPLQIHLLTLVFGQDALLPAALLLSNLATLAAFIGLGLLAAHEEQGKASSASAPARLIKVTAAYPFAFFLFGPFTEGFFLACVVFSVFCARRGHWRWAAASA